MFEYINLISKEYPIVGSTISMMIAGGFLYLLKDLPSTFVNKLMNYLTTEVSLSNHNISYYSFLEWFEGSNYKKYSRSLQVTNGRWGYESKSVMSAGQGFHFFKFKNKWAMMRVFREKTDGEKVKEHISIRYLGFSQEWGQELISEVVTEKNDHPNEYKVSIFNSDRWNNIGYEYKRCFSTVYVNDGIKNKIFDAIDKFKSSKADYIKKGIPYRLVIMLHGLPGTGKTSIIRALASKYNHDIALLRANPNNFLNAVKTAPSKAMIVLEDVDSMIGFQTRESKNIGNFVENIETEMASPRGTSEILNAMDGIGGFNNSIMIMTTNHLEKIDSAILRPGRTDLIIEIPKLKKGDIPFDIETEEITGAELQAELRKRTG